jgi:uncharacterized protein YoxC
MYWIYLIIFTAIIFVPSYITNGYYSLSLIQTQEYVILFIGLIACAIFFFREKTLQKTTDEQQEIITKINRMSRDLNQSYSYIGEMNRKIDILKTIVSDNEPDVTHCIRSKTSLFQSVLEAIIALTKSSIVAIHIVDKNGKLLDEMKSNPETLFNISSQTYCERKSSYVKENDFCMVCTPPNDDGISACIVVKCIRGMQKQEDIDIIKALSSHALFLYMHYLYEQKLIN